MSGEPIVFSGVHSRVPGEILQCVAIERGGYATYHGPGQRVRYPIGALAARGSGVASFAWTLEQIMIELAARFGVSTSRDARG